LSKFDAILENSKNCILEELFLLNNQSKIKNALFQRKIENRIKLFLQGRYVDCNRSTHWVLINNIKKHIITNPIFNSIDIIRKKMNGEIDVDDIYLRNIIKIEEDEEEKEIEFNYDIRNKDIDSREKNSNIFDSTIENKLNLKNLNYTNYYLLNDYNYNLKYSYLKTCIKEDVVDEKYESSLEDNFIISMDFDNITQNSATEDVSNIYINNNNYLFKDKTLLENKSFQEQKNFTNENSQNNYNSNLNYEYKKDNVSLYNSNVKDFNENYMIDKNITNESNTVLEKNNNRKEKEETSIDKIKKAALKIIKEFHNIPNELIEGILNEIEKEINLNTIKINSGVKNNNNLKNFFEIIDEVLDKFYKNGGNSEMNTGISGLCMQE